MKEQFNTTSIPFVKVFEYCEKCGKPKTYSYPKGLEESAVEKSCQCGYDLPKDFNAMLKNKWI